METPKILTLVGVVLVLAGVFLPIDKPLVQTQTPNNLFAHGFLWALLLFVLIGVILIELFKGRNKFVFGTGNPNAEVMVVGEGPGAEEDKQGLPFVGRAGQLLTNMLKAIKFEREEVYIANIVKCRPPGNRTPLPDEMDTCMPYLKKQYELIKPKLILCLGLTAARGLLKKRDSLTNLRGKIFEFEDAKVMVTYHSAALLRNPNWKKDCWVDLQKFRKLYDEL